MDERSFTLDPQLFDFDGMLNEAAAYAWKSELMRRFQASSDGSSQGWYSDSMLEFALQYLGVTPAQMKVCHLEEILFELFPRKVCCDSGEAAAIIQEIRSFWSFAERAFNLPNAGLLQDRLDLAATRRLERELASPANFGFAKSLFMQGQAAGVDMTTEAGLQQFTPAYNKAVPQWGANRQERRKARRRGA